MKKILSIFTSSIVLLALLTFTVNVSARGRCDVTVDGDIDPIGTLQTKIDNASTGDTVCLSGEFENEPTVIVATSNITIKAAPGSDPVLDEGDGPAFRLEDGLSNLTIEGLEISNRTGFRGGGIESWDRSTSNITIQNNHLHDNSYNGILVGSEGEFVHTNWMVRNNTVVDHGFAGIELTNCSNCTIKGNEIINAGFAGIIIQARNTSTTGATDTVLNVNSVKVLHNGVENAPFGIYALSFKGHPTSFTPIDGGSVEFTNTIINNNIFVDTTSFGVLFWGFNEVLSDNATINHNNIECDTGIGVGVIETGFGELATVRNVKVVNNQFSDDCSPNVSDGGTDSKVPPGPFGI